MKTIHFFGILFIQLLFAHGLIGQGQTTHTITLSCNTAEIEKTTVDQNCNFGQSSGTNRDFTIRVRVGDIILWKGESTSSPSDRVDIKSINYEGGTNVFDKNILRGNNQKPELVSGTVVTGQPNQEEKYKISFRVFNNGNKRNGTFHIDPKIQIIP